MWRAYCLMYVHWQTGTKAKRQQLQQGQNFRGSTLSEGSSNVGLLRGAAFGIQQEFMQFKNSLLEGKANISDAKQKRKRYKNNSQWVYVQVKGQFISKAICQFAFEIVWPLTSSKIVIFQKKIVWYNGLFFNEGKMRRLLLNLLVLCTEKSQLNSC